MARKLGGTVSWSRSQALALPHHPMSLQKAVDVDMLDHSMTVRYSNTAKRERKLDMKSTRQRTLRLTFFRRSFMKGIDPQPFTYDIDMPPKQFKQLMNTPTMARMGFFVNAFQPTPAIESTVHGREKSLVGGSRSSIYEGHRLRRELAHAEKKMKTHARMDTSKLYHVSTHLGNGLSMSRSEPDRCTHGNKMFGMGRQVEVPAYNHARTSNITGVTTGTIGLAGVRNDQSLRRSFKMTQSTCYPGLPKLQFQTTKSIEKQRSGTMDRRMIEVQPRQKCGHRLRGRSGLEFALKTEYQMNGDTQCVFHVSEAPDPVHEFDPFEDDPTGADANGVDTYFG